MKKIISLILACLLAVSVVSMLRLCSSAAGGVEIVTRIGDVNADKKITIADAKLVLQNVAGLREFGSTQKKVADVDANGKITILDARLILQHVAKIKELPEDVFSGDGWIDI